MSVKAAGKHVDEIDPGGGGAASLIKKKHTRHNERKKPRHGI